MQSLRFPSLLFVLIPLLIGSCTSPDPFENFVSQQSDSLVGHSELSSISVGILKNGKVYTFHQGQLLTGESPNNETLYEIASLTKTFTGLLLAKALHDKKVALDDDIRDVLPREYPNLQYDGQPITYRHLVTHTSGLPHLFPDTPGLFDNPNWDTLPYTINELQAGFTKNDFWEALHEVKLNTFPGQQFSYSNVGANLLALCVEQLYEQSYEDLLKAAILDPLKMDQTFVGVSKDQQGRVAVGLNANGLEMPVRTLKEVNAEGGIVSSVADMLAYMQFQLQTDHPLVQLSHEGLYNGKYGGFDNGLFWQILNSSEGPAKLFQNGGAFGTSSWMTLVPETQTGVFLITNVSGPEVHQKLSALADAIIAY